MIPSHRILTRKSKFGFGKWSDYTMQELLNLNKGIELISCYYKLTSIDYTKSILNELRIIDDYILEKPAKSKSLYYQFLQSKGYRRRIQLSSGANKLKKESKRPSKAKLKKINQGNK